MARLALFLAILLLPAIPGWARVIDTDTRWTGVREVAETVRVAPGATLRVAPGAVVTFAGGRLEVAGRLVAEECRFGGDGWQGILLKGCSAATVLRECRIEKARTGIQVMGGAPRLEGLVLRGNRVGVELRQKTAAEVTGCRFVGNTRVGLFVKDDAAPRISGNRFESNGRYGAYIYRAVPAQFAGNSFVANPTGLMISHFGSDPKVAENRFRGNDVGISVDRAARPVLTGNIVRNSATGIRLYRRSDPEIRGNLLEDNAVAVSIAYSSYPTIRENDFRANERALFLEYQSSVWERDKGAAARRAAESSRGAFGKAPRKDVGEGDRRPQSLDGRVEARRNWWGPAGTAELKRIGAGGNPSFIHDGRDQPTFEEDGQSYPLDTVRFAPWSETPFTEAARER